VCTEKVKPTKKTGDSGMDVDMTEQFGNGEMDMDNAAAATSSCAPVGQFMTTTALIRTDL
jgi:hypothetical protein